MLTKMRPEEVPARWLIQRNTLGKQMSFFLFLNLFYVRECFACMRVYAPRVSLAPAKVREGAGSPRTGVIDACKLPCGCLDLNLGPLQEQQELLATEPCLHLYVFKSKLNYTLSLCWLLSVTCPRS